MIKVFTLVFLIFGACNFGADDSRKKIQFPKKVDWKELLTGIYYAEVENPYHSKISDNIITLVRINPEIIDADIYSATSYDSIKRTAMSWSEDYDLNVVINAGMYNLSNTLSAEGFLKSNNKINNPKFKESFKMFAVFKPNNEKLRIVDLIDAENESIDGLVENYNAVFQSIRMIDCNAQQVVWKPRKTLYSSMCVLGIDKCNQIVLAFSRTPLSANQMSSILLHLPINIRSAMYLEGGPEACIYIKTPDTTIQKNGSFVSMTFPTDTNTRYWNLPNVIGFKLKK